MSAEVAVRAPSYKDVEVRALSGYIGVSAPASVESAGIYTPLSVEEGGDGIVLVRRPGEDLRETARRERSSGFGVDGLRRTDGCNATET